MRGVDPDGDRLIFGALGPEAALVTVENTGNNEAEVYLARQLDHETGTEHQILLSLTDGHLGQDNYITHSLLILVEDTNDNIPVFTELPPSVVIQEHQHPGVIAQFRATDKDSGAFGQVGLHRLGRKILRHFYLRLCTNLLQTKMQKYSTISLFQL